MHTTILFILLLVAGYISADPSKCYSCSDTSSCNDPIDVSKITIENCVPETSPESELICAAIKGINQGGPARLGARCCALDHDVPKRQAGDHPPGRAYGTYYAAEHYQGLKCKIEEDGEHETIRTCHVPTLYGMPYCVFATMWVDQWSHWTNISCITCDTDLCNG